VKIKTDELSKEPLLAVHSEFTSLQFEQAVETYRTQLTLLAQIATVLIIA
jgi:hypothetical protein